MDSQQINRFGSALETLYTFYREQKIPANVHPGAVMMLLENEMKAFFAPSDFDEIRRLAAMSDEEWFAITGD